jgi:hypothetical protein
MDSVTNVFRHALDRLRAIRLDVSLESKDFDFLRNNVVISTVLSDDPPLAGRVYDHRVRTTPPTFHFSKELLMAFECFWNERQYSAEDRLRFSQFFFAHEYKHIDQGVDSDLFTYSRQTAYLFDRFDYAADAIAIEALVRFEVRGGSDWRKCLADYIQFAIDGSTVFSFLEDESSKHNGEMTMDAARFYRNLVWMFQLARTQSLASDYQFDDFQLTKYVSIELVLDPDQQPLKLEMTGEVSKRHLTSPLRLVIASDRRLIYEAVNKEIVNHLREAVFEGSLNDNAMFWRPFWPSAGKEFVEKIVGNRIDHGGDGSLSTGGDDVLKELRAIFLRMSFNEEQRGSLVTQIAPQGTSKTGVWADLRAKRGNDGFFDELFCEILSSPDLKHLRDKALRFLSAMAYSPRLQDEIEKVRKKLIAKDVASREN